MHIFNSLAPIFLILATGAILTKTQFLSSDHLKGLNGLTYWVGLPCLLFYKIASATYTGSQVQQIFLVVVTGMAGTLILSFVLAQMLKMPITSIGTFMQASFRGNLAFVGLPVVIYTFSSLYGMNASQLETLGILVIAPMVPIYNIVSVIVLLASRRELKLHSAKLFILPVVTNPLVIASVAGVLFSLTGWALPTSIYRTMEAVGQMSLPLALISIGGTLGMVKIRGSLGLAFLASILKVAVAPIVGFYAAKTMGLGGHETRIALIYLACPTAASSFVLSDQIGGDNALAASAVVVSTGLAMISLSAAVGVPL
ncbi:AEC family transporter [candidate division KSB1 bacterium]|nr:AEC family transporter [candidate division KSB1 bacterium]NIR71795.1 AEC family transporter [candidate division KSB1 bacterium]NIS25777.1 AEC family transporter [candidate division KSB1 bacterium]NIT72647.1 AEC family transporter [candidate division KSB1 bacterium]NIU26467.1 AEC family transporter [candidate division KSB1 bacterium]